MTGRNPDLSDSQRGVVATMAVLTDVRELVEAHLSALRRDTTVNEETAQMMAAQLHAHLITALIH